MLCAAVAAVSFMAGHAAAQATDAAAGADRKKGIAVMTLKNASGITTGEAELITDRLGVELFNTGRVNVMERNQMQEVLKEQGFQQSGTCSDEACLVEMGQMLGVQFLVSGSIGKLGSMYMINLRVINVNTAEIAHVVSEDINGGIEQVVGRLKGIAQQLVTSQKAQAQTQPTGRRGREERQKEPEKKPEEKPAEAPAPTPPPEQPTPKPTETAQPAPEPQPEPAPASVDSKRAERNKNRAGLRIMATYLLGTPKGDIDDDSLRGDHFRKIANFYDMLSDDLDWDVEHSRGSFAAQLVFMIPAGRFLAVDAGLGLRYFADVWQAEDPYARAEDVLRIVTPHVTTGLAFVYRFFPGKVNVGVVADLDVNVLHYSYTFYDTDTISGGYVRNSDASWGDRAARINVAFGPRVGLEILGGPHFGFALEFSYRFSQMTTDLNLWGSEDDAKYQLKMPGVGLAAGFNFYF